MREVYIALIGFTTSLVGFSLAIFDRMLQYFVDVVSNLWIVLLGTGTLLFLLWIEIITLRAFRNPETDKKMDDSVVPALWVGMIFAFMGASEMVFDDSYILVNPIHSWMVLLGGVLLIIAGIVRSRRNKEETEV